MGDLDRAGDREIDILGCSRVFQIFRKYLTTDRSYTPNQSKQNSKSHSETRQPCKGEGGGVFAKKRNFMNVPKTENNT